MHRDQRPMHALQLPQRLWFGRHAADVLRRNRARSRQKRHRAIRQRSPRLRIHTLQPQEPVLEVSRQRLHRRAGRQRIEHRGPETIEPLVGVGLLCPLVQQLGEVTHVPERIRTSRTPTATAVSPRSSGRPAPAALSRSTPRCTSVSGSSAPVKRDRGRRAPLATPRFLPRSRVRKTTILSASPSL